MQLQLFLKLAIFILTCTVAFFIMPTIVVLTTKSGFFPDLDDELIDKFIITYSVGGIIGWAAASLIGVGYLFNQTKKRFLFLFAPVGYAIFYVTGLLMYFAIIS